METQHAPIHWIHWTRFLLIPLSFLLLVGALVRAGEPARPAPLTPPSGTVQGYLSQTLRGENGIGYTLHP